MAPASGLLRLAGTLAAIALLATSCGTETAPGADGSGTAGGSASSAPASAAPSPSDLDVASLVGTWSVSADGAPPGLLVTISPGEVTVWQDCGAVGLSWRASTSGMFAAALGSWAGECGTPARPDAAWLEAVAGWQPEGTGIRLVDPSGAESATLEPAAPPTVKAYAGIRVPDQASLTDEMRRALNATPSMGAGVSRAATRELLVGAWVAVPPATAPADSGALDRETPGFTLAEDGLWKGTDGCNGGGGRWNADAEGRIIATSGNSTLVGCNNIDAPRWLGGAWLAGFTSDGTLVLYDYEGAELGRLTRA
ncbi:hypothetical protein [Longivirga aurantiaca]|uniref:META domain-containing protein n=1 Tax=Longivirga aurantiaca TaxID=1837743 RepID=A0ABW1SV57_9ACTN